MDDLTRNEIYQLIKDTLVKKFEKYDPESKSTPFYDALFSRKAIFLSSLMHSLYTTFGMSLYEQIAGILAIGAGYQFKRGYKLLGTINDETRLLISHISSSDIRFCKSKDMEIKLIRESSTLGKPDIYPDSTVDVFIIDNDGVEYYVDITTVKPNKKETRALRKKMLDWAALRFSQDLDAKLKTIIGIPFNPYHPNPYNRSFVRDNCHYEEVLIQEDLWKLFAGEDVYKEMLQIFEEVGEKIKDDVNNFIGY